MCMCLSGRNVNDVEFVIGNVPIDTKNKLQLYRNQVITKSDSFTPWPLINAAESSRKVRQFVNDSSNHSKLLMEMSMIGNWTHL